MKEETRRRNLHSRTEEQLKTFEKEAKERTTIQLLKRKNNGKIHQPKKIEWKKVTSLVSYGKVL